MEGTLSPYACGSSQLVQVVGIKCDVTQMATVVLAKTLVERQPSSDLEQGPAPPFLGHVALGKSS